MFQDSPMTAAENEADRAWEDFAQAHRQFIDEFGKVDADQAELRVRLQRVATAEKHFKCRFLAIDDPTPPSKEVDTAWLGCEGAMLVTVLAAYLALVLPEPGSLIWSAGVALGGAGVAIWTFGFLSRLLMHWRLP